MKCNILLIRYTRCDAYRRTKCNARAIIKSTGEIELRGNHELYHERDNNFLPIRKFEQDLKEEVSKPFVHYSDAYHRVAQK